MHAPWVVVISWAVGTSPQYSWGAPSPLRPQPLLEQALPCTPTWWPNPVIPHVRNRFLCPSWGRLQIPMKKLERNILSPGYQGCSNASSPPRPLVTPVGQPLAVGGHRGRWSGLRWVPACLGRGLQP